MESEFPLNALRDNILAYKKFKAQYCSKWLIIQRSK